MADDNYSSFEKFGELPPELRIKIWQHAIPGPRTVIVESPFTRAQNRAPKSLEDALGRTYEKDAAELNWRSTTRIPTLLHVNAEARHEALQHYQLSLGVGSARPRIYVDFSRDTLFFGLSETMPECSSLWGTTKDLQKVRKLAIVPESAWRAVSWQAQGFNHLKKITFVHDTEDIKLGPQHQLVEDVTESTTEPESSTQEDDQVSFQEAEHGHMQQGDESPQENPISLAGSMAKCNPTKRRMQEAREEVHTLTQVLPGRWDREPEVSTALFRVCPGGS